MAEYISESFSAADRLNENMYRYAGNLLRPADHIRGRQSLEKDHLETLREYCEPVIGPVDEAIVGWEPANVEEPPQAFIRLLSGGIVLKYTVITEDFGTRWVKKEVGSGMAGDFAGPDHHDSIKLSKVEMHEWLRTRLDCQVAPDDEILALNIGLRTLV